jgi:enoyl-CoA hydratase
MSVHCDLEDHVARITLDRPAKLNAMNRAGWLGLRSALVECSGDSSLRGVVITGAGERAFVAGADVDEMLPRPPLMALEGLAQQVVQEIADLPVVTVAAMNGHALGGGFEIALACDLRLATPHATMGLPELGLGIVPGAGGTNRLLQLVGLGRATEMILMGRRISADEAKDVGLVHRVVPPADLMSEARSMVEVVAGKGPVAVRLAKTLLRAASATTGTSDLERVAYTLAFCTEDRTEGMRAFAEGRPPHFSGS